MALEYSQITPIIVKKHIKPTIETAGSMKIVYESIGESVNIIKKPISELLELVNNLEPNLDLAESIEKSMGWRSKVKIPRKDI